MSNEEAFGDPSTRIAETEASPLRVLSGPGTGKTHALKKKVALLLNNGVPPKTILATTFTRTAAGDLKKALQEMNVPAASLVHSTTVHSLCFRILNRESVFQATRRVPRPLLDFEKRFMMEDLKHAKLGNVNDLKKRLLAFAAAWARNQQDKAGWPNSRLDKRFEISLMDWLAFHKAMLIEELVPVALRYLRNNPLSAERTAYSHILVDEYQDLNVSEQEFINIISENGKLTAIGDENQSIYSFKHAHPEGIIDFGDRHRETTDITLDVCWRCPSNIVEMANALISHNRQLTKRKLRAHPDNKLAEIHIVQWPTMEQECIGIAGITKELIDQGLVEPGRVLILAPRKQFGYEVRDALKSLGTPAHSFFKEQELDGNPKELLESRAQQAFTLLTLVANPDDHVALRCWCGFGSSDFRAGAWNRLRRLCTTNDISLRQAIEDIENGKRRLSHGRQITERLQHLRELLDELSSLQGQDLFDKLFPRDDPDFVQIRDVMTNDIEDDEDAKSILDKLQTCITQPELPTDVEFVRVMSLHKSKGLTADLVFVVGCIESLIPNLPDFASAEESQKVLEEQRRLFYVAITRARRFLVLSSVLWIPKGLAHNMRVRFHQDSNGYARTIASEFMNELGPNRPHPIAGAKLMQILRERRGNDG
ncbi:MAG: ATP-dependent helicase [Gammaproteobacteria bacterium]|nr:ATP-dependent helicase [Gammaproteobacteria bacterium]